LWDCFFIAFDKEISYQFLNSFFDKLQEYKSLDFYDSIFFSLFNDDFFFSSINNIIVFNDLFSFINKFFFSTFYYTMYFDSYVLDDIPFKSFYERDFKFSDFDILGRSSEFDDYFSTCNFVEFFFDFFFDSFYTTFSDYDSLLSDSNYKQEINNLKIVEMFNDAENISLFADISLSTELSFNEFIFLENIYSFEDFFQKYSYNYISLLSNFFFFLINYYFFLNFFR
jgi:hypothetical protein